MLSNCISDSLDRLFSEGILYIFFESHLESNNLIALLDYLVHILHCVNWTHLAAFLTTGFNTSTAGKDLTAGPKEFLSLFNGIKLSRAYFLVFNAFAGQENLDFIFLPKTEISVP